MEVMVAQEAVVGTTTDTRTGTMIMQVAAMALATTTPMGKPTGLGDSLVSRSASLSQVSILNTIEC